METTGSSPLPDGLGRPSAVRKGIRFILISAGNPVL
jgi:hypothetical protein